MAPTLNTSAVLQGPTEAKLDWDALSGNVVVLKFWATWCAPCVASINHLNDLSRAFAHEPVQFIAISSEAANTVTDFLKHHVMPGYIVIDKDHITFDTYCITAIPQMVVIDQKGKIAAITHPNNLTEATIQNVLLGRPAGTPEVQLVTQADRDSSLCDLSVIRGLDPGDYIRGGSWNPSAGRYCAATSGTFDLRQVLAFAYNVHPWQVLGASSLESTWSIMVRVPNNSKESAQLILRTALEATLGYKAVREQKQVALYELRAGKSLEGHAPGSGDGPMRQEIDSGRAFLRLKNVKSATLANELSRLCGVHVVDVAEVPLRFDLALELTSDVLDLDAGSIVSQVQQNLENQTGLILTPAVQASDVITITKLAN